MSGAATGNVPTSTVGNFGELARIVDWIDDAYREIQGAKRYSFLRQAAQITFPVGANVVVPSTFADAVPRDRYRKTVPPYTLDSSGQRFYLDLLDYDEFDVCNTAQDIAAAAQATAMTIRPHDCAAVINWKPTTTPLVVYTVRYRNPHVLIADNDVPLLPEDLHMLIVYTAMIRYADFDEAGALRRTTEAKRLAMEMDLDDRCLPKLRFGGTLLDD